MDMLDKIKKLYLQGRFNSGVFTKTARLIVGLEMEKLALSQADINAAQVVAKAAESAASAAAIAAKRAVKIVGSTLAPDASRGARLIQYMKTNPIKSGLGAIATLGTLEYALDTAIATFKRSRMDTILDTVLTQNPELDPAKAKINFEALKDMAPSMASNFASAEGYLRQMEQYPYLHPAQVTAVSQIEKNVIDAKSRKPGTGMSGLISGLGKSLAKLVVGV